MKQASETNSNENKLPSLHFKIQKLEERNWYGTALLLIVSALILISTLIYAVMGFEESTPVVLINGLLIILHMVLVYLSKTDKLIAYSGGLLVFIIYLFLNQILAGSMLIGGWKLSLIIIFSYFLFINESYILKKLHQQLEE